MKLGIKTSQPECQAWPVRWVNGHGKPQGVALVATLIMLSLVTFMTVAFLGVARRERRSMEAHLSQGDANNAMYAALNMAQTELISRLLSPDGKGNNPDPFSYTLFGSTNYLNPAGFAIGANNEANVNDYQTLQFIWDFGAGHTNWLQHLKNLKILPRVPVFNQFYTNGYTDTFTNGNATNVEGRFGRFYLDFNRNGHFEPTFSLGHEQGTFSGGGHANWLSNLTVNAFGNGYFTGSYSGDPQWIGILEDPSQPHGPSNQFVGRYAFLVLPAGKSLDINNAHNQNKINNTNRSSTYTSNGFVLPHTLFDGYTRNHGVAGWEINLAAFLAGLNTNNSWYYDWVNYNPGLASPMITAGDTVFQDAADLIRHRYNTNFQELTNISGMMGANGAVHLSAGGADLMGEFYPTDFDRGLTVSYLDRDGRIGYHRNSLVTDSSTPKFYHWAGSANIDFNGGGINEYKTIEELFRPRAFYQRFQNRLNAMSDSADPATLTALPVDQMRALDDRYTFYRLLSQMGTESEAPEGKVNLNFDNTAVGGGFGYPDDSGRLVNGTYAGWTPLGFFTNVAQSLIDSSITTNVSFSLNGGTGFGRYLTNYTLGSLLDGDNTNRYTIIGGQTRFLTNNQWIRQERQVYYPSNLISDSSLKLTNITVFPYNQYTPTLHRLLQVAANLHETAGNSRDWRTNRAYFTDDLVRRYGRYYRANGNSTGIDPANGGGVGSWVLDDPGLPHVFRPVFRVNTNFTPASIFISEWLEVTNAFFTNITYLDLSDVTNRSELLAVQNGASTLYPGFVNSDFMMKGFPLVIGAKGPTRNSFSVDQEVVGAGIPNFNEISFKALFSVSRKLRLVETNKNDFINPEVHSQYIVGLRIGMGVEAWNPYRFHRYPRNLELQVVNRMQVSLENDVGPVYTNTLIFSNSTFVAGNSWEPSGVVTASGNSAAALDHNSFRTILGEYRTAIPESVYYPPAYAGWPGIGPAGYLDTNWFLPNLTNNINSIFLPTNIHPDLDLRLVISNWFTYTAIDTTFPNGRIVDHVNLTNLVGEIDLVDMLVGQTNRQLGGLNLVSKYFDPRRATNFYLINGVYVTNGMPLGVINQLRTSMDVNWRTNQAVWRAFDPSIGNPGGAVTNTRRIYGVLPDTRSSYSSFAGFNPTVVMEQDLIYEVNDPLVHHLTSQLVTADRETQSSNATPNMIGLVLTNYSDSALWFNPPIGIGPPGTIGRLNGSYRPWGGNPAKGATGSKQASEHFNMGIKDPSVYFADDWDFPERKFGSIGWMGRVHRGTPWQTIYMKSRVASRGEWAAWGADRTGSQFEYPITEKRITDGVAILRTSRAHRFGLRQEVLVDIGDARFDGSRRVVELDGSSFTIEFYLSEANLAAEALAPNGSVTPLAEYQMDMHPTNDWRLFDGISAHLSRKMARGLLGVNQTNYAAWAAVMGGLSVMTNIAMYPAAQTDPDAVLTNIGPTFAQMHRIHRGILQTRKDAQSFTTLGDILAVPELSCGSPYLNMERNPYYHLFSYARGSEVTYRGVRWRANLSSGAAVGDYPPSMREHQIPEYNYASLTNLMGIDNPIEFGTYIWYRDSSIGRVLVRAVATTFNVPVTTGVVNAGWQQSRWQERQINSLQTEAYGFTESMVERIPQKIMGLLKRDPHPRVVVYAFGQALAPADQAKYLFPGPFQGMVTNYQVIGEVSSRTLLRVEGIPEPGLIPFNTNAAAAVFPRVVIEDHKLLGRQ